MIRASRPLGNGSRVGPVHLLQIVGVEHLHEIGLGELFLVGFVLALGHAVRAMRDADVAIVSVVVARQASVADALLTVVGLAIRQIARLAARWLPVMSVMGLEGVLIA
jgi:hypothetical protein